MQIVDLRSDTVTRPTPAMRAAMSAAEVGDDVFGEDPTVNRLEAMAAERFGHESSLLVASGTQGNLLALLTHCGRGDEYICGQQAHNYRTEGGGAAVLGGIQPQPIEVEADGTLDLGHVAADIKPHDFHYARTRLLSLENTISGKVLPLAYMREARALCDRHGLALHLDGARVCNAAVALGVEVAEITSLFDSVSICLSKGLGCPAGTLPRRRPRFHLGGEAPGARWSAAGCVRSDSSRRRGSTPSITMSIGSNRTTPTPGGSPTVSPASTASTSITTPCRPTWSS